MPRGKGQPRSTCFCFVCKRNFKSCREDATTCSVKCRKAKNRLLGGSDSQRKKPVTDSPDALFRVYLDRKWIGTYATRELAECAIAGWLREWDGEFTIKS
jgi:hypothetical protein